MLLSEQEVHIAVASDADYRKRVEETIPELPDRYANVATMTLRNLFRSAGLDREAEGTSRWNPLGALIGENKRVLIKPNWVYHENRAGYGLDCMLTHPTLIDAMLAYVQKTNPKEVILGDAPIRKCNFSAIIKTCGIDELLDRYQKEGMPLELRDFRKRTQSAKGFFESEVEESSRGEDEFCLFDLKGKSALDPITDGSENFRITQADPAEVNQTHQKGKHQYLVAKEVMDCDVFISMPKLKTHRKAGVTGALKNVVGINGLKDYLPHHRKGGTNKGGDCYPGHSAFAELKENLSDKMYSSEKQSRWHQLQYRIYNRLNRLLGRHQLEGSWKGNDTIWRTCLDLQKIVKYGRPDGTLAQDPQRALLHLTDAIIAGEGEGPMHPSPKPLGVLTLGSNAAAIEWIHACLMRLDPQSIPLIREACLSKEFSLHQFSTESIKSIVNGIAVSPDRISEQYGDNFLLPRGWQ